MTDGREAPTRTTSAAWPLLLAGVFVATGLAIAAWGEMRSHAAVQLVDRCSTIPSAPTVLGACSAFGAVLLVGLIVLRAPRWTLVVPGAAAAIGSVAAAWRLGLVPAALGGRASFQERAETLARGIGSAGDVAAAGLAWAALLLGVAAIAIGARTDESKETDGDAAAPAWSFFVVLPMLFASALFPLLRRASASVTELLGVVLPCALGLAGAALACRRRGPGATRDALAALAAGAGAVLVWAVAASALAPAAADAYTAADPAQWPAIVRAEAWTHAKLVAPALAPLLFVAAVATIRPRHSLRAIIALRAAAGLAAVVLAPLVAAVLVGRSRIDRIATLETRSSALLERPGIPVEDDELASGTLAVELVSPVDSLVLEEAATVLSSPGGGRTAWSAGDVALLENVPPSGVDLAVDGPYVAEAPHVSVAGSHGARVALRALPHHPARPRPTGQDYPPQRLEVDLGQPKSIVMTWVRGPVPIVIFEIPREGAFMPRVEDSPFARRVENEYKTMGEHRDPADKKFDRAQVLAPAGAPFTEVLGAVQALRLVQRDWRVKGIEQRVSAFEVELTLPPPPRVVVADERAEAIAAVAAKRPPNDRSTTFLEALATCRSLTCSPRVYARLWSSLGVALADEGSDRATDAFFRARLVDPGATLDAAASDAARRAFEAALARKPRELVVEPLRISGRIKPEAVEPVLREADGVVRLCFDLIPPGGDGSAQVRAVVARDGAVHFEMPEPSPTQECIGRALARLTFPKPEGGIATLFYKAKLADGTVVGGRPRR